MIKKSKITVLRLAAFLTLFLVAAFFENNKAYAVPAEPSPHKFCQPDGSSFTGYLRGDETFNWVEDEYKNIIAYDEKTKGWYYADVIDNDFIPGKSLVGKTEDKVTRVKRQDSLDIIDQNKASLFELGNQNRSSKQVSTILRDWGENYNTIIPKDNQELLLIQVEFSDSTMKKSAEYWHEKFFGSGKSVAEYYKDMSMGKNIFIPATTQNLGIEINSSVSSSISYSGSDTRVSGVSWASAGVKTTVSNEYDGIIKVRFDLVHPIKKYNRSDTKCVQNQIAIATMAIKAIEETTNFDFDGLGVQKQVAIIVAGREVSAYDDADLIGEVWAHTSYFDGSVVGKPNKSFLYSIFGEMYNNTEASAIGVACHELGHLLGLPDLYNTDSTGEGIGCYSLMATGNWGYTDNDDVPGSTPVALDAWSKCYLGYCVPIECEENIYDTIDVKSGGEIGSGKGQEYNVVKLCNSDVDPSQYFLVENRQDKGWDAGMQLYGEAGVRKRGILILQVDENIPFNVINNSDRHRGVDIVGSPKDTGACFNYFYELDGERECMSPGTTPNSMFYKKRPLTPVLSTRDKDSNISLHVKSKSSDRMTVEVGEDSGITSEFSDEHFLAEIRSVLGKTSEEPILKSDLLSVTSLDLTDKSICNFEGIEYFRKLKEFTCIANELTDLDMSGNPELETLDCSYIETLEFLDVTKNPKLRSLEVNYSALSALDVTHNSKLETLLCCDSFIDKLDISKNPQLKKLKLWGNTLMNLDVSKNAKLTYLDCRLNYMTSPDDVKGWQEIGLVLGDNFLFNPQEGPEAA